MSNMVISIGSFAILTVLWLGFGTALIFNQALLDMVWHTFRSFPIIVQIVIGLLLLPLIIGLWIWQTPWPLWIRLVLLIGLAWATLYTFFPKQS